MTLTESNARRFLRLVLDAIHREYPTKIAHTMASDGDLAPPRALTPAFYGSFDWHSAVHGHWTLARIMHAFPGADFDGEVRAALAKSITERNIAAEVKYLSAEGR